ncbi:MAG: glycosyltransferase family 4 protein [Verrucomicrobia bacterium]|nr:glycosyltransferase family 4 protein [Verrucomicrobiota bacterium]
MRVTHVITRLIVGGAQENTIASVLGLQQKPGLEVNLISGASPGSEGSLESAFVNSPGSLRVLPELVRPVHPLKDCRAMRHLTALFRTERPHLVHTHSGKAGVLGRLAAARAGVPIIVHTIHGPSFGPFQGVLSNWIFLSAERLAGRVTTHFVSVADAMTEQYLNAGIGRRDQFTTILSGFDLAPYLSTTNDPALRASLGIAPTDFVVGQIARLFKLKGHEDLFRVASALVQECPQIKFLLVGDGPWRRRFENQARAMGLERQFIFTGLVPPAQVPSLVGIMDAVVHLSLREGLPRALPQALAAARPVVAYDCGGAKEICITDETGFLLSPGNTSELTARLLQLARDSSLRERLGRRGQQMVKERFDVNRMVADLYALYLKLAAEKHLTHT